VLYLADQIVKFDLTEKEKAVADYMTHSAGYKDMLGRLEASHERQKHAARKELEVSIQTQVAVFERDWEEQWARKVKGMARNVLKRMSDAGEVAPEEEGAILIED
jgi:hypothetical protein